jgi:hypothetical protein
MGSPFRSVAIIGVVVLLLAAGAVVVALVIDVGEPAVYPEDSPEGTVQRYIQALYDGDVDTAYDYLSERVQSDYSRSEFRDHLWWMSGNNVDRRIRIAEVDVDDDHATLTLAIEHFSGSGLDFNRYTYRTRVRLVREDGEWKIDQLLTDVGQSVPVLVRDAS